MMSIQLCFFLSLIIFVGVSASSSSDFNSVLTDLTSGKLLQWIVVPSECVQSSSSSSDSIVIPDKLVATIDNWEYFYDARFGPQKYFAVSYEGLFFDEKGMESPFYRLVTLRVYDNSTVGVTIEHIATTSGSWTQTGVVTYSCSLLDNGVRFVSKSLTSWHPLTKVDDAMNAVDYGNRVTYVTQYANCYFGGEQSMGAIGGSSLDSGYDLVGDVLTWRRRTLIKNYQGEGYVYDAVEMTASRTTGMINITASDIITTTYAEEYIETFNCDLNKAVTFYSERI